MNRTRSASGYILLLLVLACGTDPGAGEAYTLQTINGRQLPTYPTATPPQDSSSLLVVLGMEYHFPSATALEFGVWRGLATFHPDGSVTFPLAGCSQGFRYSYLRRGDSLLIGDLLYPGPEPPRPFNARIAADGDLYVTLVLPDTLVLRFTKSERVDIPCG
jgi:hypothetical protein